jgi:hypothetical protein
MKKLVVFSMLFTAMAFNGLTAGEPPEEFSIKSRVRMSTLILVGRAVKVLIVDTHTGKPAKNQKSIKEYQKVRAQIRVERVLYSGPSEAMQPGTHPEVVEVVFDEAPGWDVRGPGDSNEIFFLTRDTVPQSGDYHPFYNWANLSVPITEEAEVTRIIAAFEAVK